MGRKKKYGDDVRDRALALMKGGASVRDAARQVGVPPTTVEKWKQGAAAPSAPAPAAPKAAAADRVKRGVVSPPPAAGGGAAAGSGAGGADAARKAAGATAPPPTAQPTKPGQAAPEGAPPIAPEMALLMMTGLALQMTTRVYCARFKVPYDESMKAAARLTEEEAGALQEMAPHAAPFAGELLSKYGKYAGLIIYGGLFYMALADRAQLVKSKADPSVFKKKGQAPARPMSPKPDQVEEDEVEEEDADDLGDLADIVRAANGVPPTAVVGKVNKAHPNAPKLTPDELAKVEKEAARAWSGDSIPHRALDKDGA